jgi:hypothetical protein
MSKTKKVIVTIIAIAFAFVAYQVGWAYWAIHKSKIILEKSNISAIVVGEPNLLCTVYEISNPQDLLVTFGKSSMIDAYRLNLQSKEYYPVLFVHQDRPETISVQNINSHKDVYEFDCNEQDNNSFAIIFNGSKCPMAEELPIFKKKVILRKGV